MVEIADIALAVVAFGPALGLLFYTLRNYTYPRVEKPFFDDRKLFGMLTLGLVLGMVFFFIDTAMFPSVTSMTIMLIALLVPILQGLIKLAILNWPKLQRKVDTAFYGLALGLGISATYAFARMSSTVRQYNLPDAGGLDALTAVIVALMGIQMVLIQASTSAMIGVGVVRGQQWSYFGVSLIYALSYSFLMYGALFVAEWYGDIGTLSLIIASLIVCIHSYWHVWRIDYPNLVEDAKRGLKATKKRKAA